MGPAPQIASTTCASYKRPSYLLSPTGAGVSVRVRLEEPQQNEPTHAHTSTPLLIGLGEETSSDHPQIFRTKGQLRGLVLLPATVTGNFLHRRKDGWERKTKC